ncbi:DUF4418 family protein [Treponema putidum]|uniref:DUF4418 family protein n=1 Tax=Treponema putidum TaxID=221027 RepID=A0AAE9SH69_9SPIR|nr:DUF4418 family protein [Treponema putidum]AIN94674.1 membrane protein [Treponema putidum]TWI77538.1 uncharacterized protein DUF4418 [Treponema putidum]UTY28690.1 DUF4418 family protein [Treponema putidum]UTY31121.1 DUF4418 family protein [Treponema putidum]UTY33558.1 DUF4418 family protein [Treponema putidum]
MKRYIFSIFIIIIGLLVLFAPFGFAHVCSPKADGSFMKCHWMGEAVRLLGGLITLSGLAFFICKKSRFGISVYNIGIGGSLILLETLVIGTCKNLNMNCNVYTKPIVILLAIALITVSIVYVFLSRKEKHN